MKRGNIAAALNEALISDDFPVWRDDDLNDDDLGNDDLDDNDLDDDDEYPQALTPVALTPVALTPDTFVREEISASYDDYSVPNDSEEKTPQKAVPYRAYETLVTAPIRPYENPIKAPNQALNSLTKANTIGIQIEGIISRPNQAIEWKKRWIWQPGITPP